MMSLKEAIAYHEREGMERVTVSEFCARFAALGYRVDRDGDCKGAALLLDGDQAGRRFLNCNTGLKEADTGARAWHKDARRDSNFRAMQALRDRIFAVTRDGYLLFV